MSKKPQDDRSSDQVLLESGQSAAPEVSAGPSRTRLIEHRLARRDDAEILELIQDLPGSDGPRCRVLRAGLLNEAGELYREVDLMGEYQALMFYARMNASGFCWVKPDAPLLGQGYDSVITKR